MQKAINRLWYSFNNSGIGSSILPLDFTLTPTPRHPSIVIHPPETLLIHQLQKRDMLIIKLLTNTPNTMLDMLTPLLLSLDKNL